MDVRLPRLGEGADSGTVAGLFVKVGDTIRKDQPVLELESEKAVASIPSPSAGTVTAIHVKEGDQLKVGQLILTVDEGAAPAPVPRVPREEIEVAESHAAPPVAAPPVAAPAALPPEDDVMITGGNGVPPAASPSLRRMARDLGIDLSRVRGSERGGRIVLADLRRYIQRLEQIVAQASRPQTVPVPGAVPAAPRPAAPSVDFSRWGKVRAEKMTTIRRTISTRMLESWNGIPHVTQFDHADITEVLKLRKKHAAAYEKKGGHLTLTPFLLMAIARTLKKHPKFNASIDEAAGEIIFKEYCHVGIAVDTEQGLIVPVLRDVDKKSLLDLSRELAQLAERTRERKVGLEEMQGGTFTISNQGGIGSGHFTPIINRPEVAILGVARGEERVVVRGKATARRTLLPVSLSYDHRIIDGADAARFMVDFVAALEGVAEKDIRL